MYLMMHVKTSVKYWISPSDLRSFERSSTGNQRQTSEKVKGDVIHVLAVQPLTLYSLDVTKNSLSFVEIESLLPRGMNSFSSKMTTAGGFVLIHDGKVSCWSFVFTFSFLFILHVYTTYYLYIHSHTSILFNFSFICLCYFITVTLEGLINWFSANMKISSLSPFVKEGD